MRIIYQNTGGQCSVVVSSPEWTGTMEDLATKVVPAGTPYKIVPVSEVPSDRTYRNAWDADVVTGKVTHNMPRAREIHKKYMRAARKPLLEALDTAYMQADERGPAGAADKATIAAQKQVLRDVTLDAGIAAATTVAELKAVWPVALGANPLVSL